MVILQKIIIIIIQYNTIQCKQFNAMQYNTMQYKTIVMLLK